jgi:hypothetical protein
MNPTFIQRAAELCVQSYKSDESLKPEWHLKAVRVVNLYKVTNEIKASIIVRNDESTDEVYVVFRGTVVEMIGNWIFANMQLFKAKYSGSPLKGTIHMGFYRAFHWLWNGDEEPKPDFWHKLLRWCLFAVRHALIIAWILSYGFVAWQSVSLPAPVPLLAWVTIIPALLIPLALWAGLIVWEVGALEDLFKGKDPDVGNAGDVALAQHLQLLEKFDNVIFTGHSLGGAMATLAFADFQKQTGGQKGWLVTFGAPRLADRVCMKAFESDHQGRYLHVINCGDPVPEVPGTLRDAKMLEDAGWMGGVLKWVGRFRRIWAFLYWQKPPGRWTEPPNATEWVPGVPVMKVGQPPLDFENHRTENYRADIEKKLRRKC